MVTVKIITPGEDYSEASQIRFSVFVKEQGIPQENEYDEKDKYSYHAVLFENEIPVACGRLYYTDKIAHIGRVAVLKQYRRKGYATTVCKKLMDIAKASKKADIITLDAQKYIVGLYKKLGFKVVGKEFLEENIPHLKMEMRIKISTVDKFCSICTIVSCICALIILIYGKFYHTDYYSPPFFEYLTIIAIVIGTLYFFENWLFIIIIVIYKLIKRERSWFILFLSIISYIIFIIVWVRHDFFQSSAC